MALEGLKVVAVFEAGWTKCQSAQGDAFYFNLQTDEVSGSLPPAAGAMAAELEGAAPVPCMQEPLLPALKEVVMPVMDDLVTPAMLDLHQIAAGMLAQAPTAADLLARAPAPEVLVQQLLPQPQLVQKVAAPPLAQAQVQSQPGERPAMILQELGDWMICEDGQGEFYWHTPTSQSHDTPPAELLILHGKFKQEQSMEQETRQRELRELWHVKQQQLRTEHQMHRGILSGVQPSSCNVHVTYRPLLAPALNPVQSSQTKWASCTPLAVQAAAYHNQHGLPQ